MAAVRVEASELPPLLLVQTRRLEGGPRAVEVDEVRRFSVVQLLVVLARVQRDWWCRGVYWWFAEKYGDANSVPAGAGYVRGEEDE
uniref:Uncharacterized protein n=1 Tax=Knipowitschia caucasica TaxID=637954 RepID=A0AAV2K908_KNICA